MKGNDFINMVGWGPRGLILSTALNLANSRKPKLVALSEISKKVNMSNHAVKKHMHDIVESGIFDCYRITTKDQSPYNYMLNTNNWLYVALVKLMGDFDKIDKGEDEIIQKDKDYTKGEYREKGDRTIKQIIYKRGGGGKNKYIQL